MTHTFRSWTGLGLGLAMISAGLGACGKAEPPEGAATPVANASAEGAVATDAFDDDLAAASGGEGEGEGGISLEAAATDPVIYGAALALTEAHIIAARDAYALGEVDAAAEMFAHPVSEVLIELEDLFIRRGVVLFDQLLLDASAAVLAGDSVEAINARADEIIAALRAAGEHAPATSRSAVSVRASVVADQAERAAAMYRIAQAGGGYEPYLDGYGFYRTGLSLFHEAEAEIVAANPSGAAALNEAFSVLAGAYPDAGPQSELSANVSALTAAASTAVLATNR